MKQFNKKWISLDSEALKIGDNNLFEIKGILTWKKFDFGNTTVKNLFYKKAKIGRGVTSKISFKYGSLLDK